MLTLHHLNNSRSQRILWLLEELGVEYEIKHHARDPKTSLAPPELLAVHPLGKSPVISDGEVTVAESGAIIEYLVEVYGEGRLIPPAGTAARRQYTYWLHHAEGSLAPLLVMSLIFRRVANAPMPFFIKPVAKSLASKVQGAYLAPNIKRNLEFMEHTLSQTQWFAGDEMTAADIQVSFGVEAALVRAGLDSYPKLSEFLTRIHARPAYQKALERGGPYQLLDG